MAQVHKLAQKTREMAAAREAANRERSESRQAAANAMMERNLVLAALLEIQGGPIVIPHDVLQRIRGRVSDVRLDPIELDVIVPRPVGLYRRLHQRFFGGGPVPKVKALRISFEDPKPAALPVPQQPDGETIETKSGLPALTVPLDLPTPEPN
jgi:hypothetical protein